MHDKIIIDSDSRFQIDIITRDVIKTTEDKSVIMQFDHNSERFGFSIPRYIEGHDMLECDKVEVHFVNESSEGVQVKDKYTVDDLAVDPDDEWKLNFSWLLSGNTSKHEGKLAFSIRFTCLKEDGKIDYSWGTSIYSAITVEKGMFNDEVILAENPDAFERLRKELEEYITEGAQCKTAIVIGNSANGATLDTCDFLYNEGEDFVDVFNDAYALASQSGIKRIEVLFGVYEFASTVSLEQSVEVIGIGKPNFGMRVTFETESGPFGDTMTPVYAARTFFYGGLDRESYTFENFCMGGGWEVTPFNVNGSLTLKNIESNYNPPDFLYQNIYPENVYIENCKFVNLDLGSASKSRVFNSTIETLKLRSGTSENIVFGNTITTLLDEGSNNLITNNIIDGVPQSSGSGSDGKSAYEIAQEHGFEGTEEEWLESLKGAGTTSVAFNNGSIIPLADNTNYVTSEDIDTLTIQYPDTDFICSIAFTTAETGDITISLPNSKYIGEVPEFSNGETWELNIKNGVVVGGKVE